MHLNNSSRRSRLARTVALAVGALSVAGMALVGTPAASAAPETNVAPAPAAAPEREADEICLEISASQSGGDEDCGGSVSDTVRRIRSVGFSAEDEDACVFIRSFRDWDRDCEDSGDTARASVRRGAWLVALRADDTVLCGRTSSVESRRWTRTRCSREGGYLVLWDRGRMLDGLRVWID